MRSQIVSAMAAGVFALPAAALAHRLPQEIEPNATAGEATPLVAPARIQGNILPNGDVDVYSFTASAGDRVFAATMTSWSASASTDSVLDLLDTDGTTVLETDNDDGTLGATSSSIAGAVIPADGTYYLRVRHSVATGQLRPYELYVVLRGGLQQVEVEPNDVFPGTPLSGTGWAGGALANGLDVDNYAIDLQAGETVFVSLDLDPERDTVEWNGRVGLGTFGGLVLVVNDAGAETPDSEALFMTARNAGTYGIQVLSATGVESGTYQLSAQIFPAPPPCLVANSLNVPVAIPAGPGVATSTLDLPPGTTIGDLNVSIDLTHNFMADLDVTLTSPSGTVVALFTDVGSSTSGVQTAMSMNLDDEAAVPAGTFTVVDGLVYKPELATRLEWFDGQDTGGTWTLTIHDDAAGDGGTLNGWGLTICPEVPLVPPGSPTVYFEDFEANDGGYTHSGVQDEWEWGTPVFAPITTAFSGTNCWTTDLDNTYNASSSQDLVSPPISLVGVAGTIELSWAQRFHIESATFDHARVIVRQAGGANPRTVWEWTGATMSATIGNPATTVPMTSGWGIQRADISDFAGQTIEVVFHLDSDTTVQLTGLAIDDVRVRRLAGEINLNTGRIGFGHQDVDAGPSSPLPVLIQNLGPNALEISAITLGGSDAGEFLILSDTGQAALASGEVRTLEVALDPTAEGPLAGTLSIFSNDTDESLVTVALSGFGNDAVAVPPLDHADPPMTFTSAPALAIPTGPAVVSAEQTVSGVAPHLWDLNLQTFITHTFAADLDITIQSPAGTVVTLTTDNGGGNDNTFNGTVWDDQADRNGQLPYTTNEGLATDGVYATLVSEEALVPEEALGAFIGEDPNGTWVLTISDDLGGDGGILHEWSLQVTACDAIVPLVTLLSNASAEAISSGAPSVTTSTITAAGLTDVIVDVDVTTFLQHTFAADVDMTLQSPAGTIVTLTTDNGSSHDNVFNGTVWDDGANPDGQVPYASNTGLAADSVYANLVVQPTLVPEDALAAFNGEDPNGDWILTVSDDTASDGGTLTQWDLAITTGFVPFADAVASPASLEFGNQDIDDGPTAAQNVTIENTGNIPLNFTGSGLQIVNSAASDYAFAAPPDTSPIPPLGVRVVGIVFDPATVGFKPPSLRITTDDPGEPTILIPLTGRGVRREADVTPLALDFGEHGVGTGLSVPRAVTLQNSGSGPLSFTGLGVSITGANAADFLLTAPPDVTLLAPGASRVYAVTFDPSIFGPHVASLDITTNDADEATISVPLTGQATVFPSTEDIVSYILGLLDPLPPPAAFDLTSDGRVDASDIVDSVNP